MIIGNSSLNNMTVDLNQQITNTTNVKLFCSVKRKKPSSAERERIQSTAEGKLSLINNYQKNIIANDLDSRV